MSPRLVVIDEDNLPVGTPVEIDNEITIGRGDQFVKDDKYVSVLHAKVWLKPDSNGQWMIEDMGSTNATFLNGRQVHVQLLKDGDVIGIGRTRIRFENLVLGIDPKPAMSPTEADITLPEEMILLVNAALIEEGVGLGIRLRVVNRLLYDQPENPADLA